MKTEINKIATMKNNTGTYDAWDNRVGKAVIYVKASDKCLSLGYTGMYYVIDFSFCKIELKYESRLGRDYNRVVKSKLYSSTKGNLTTVTTLQSLQFNNSVSRNLKKAI